MYNREILNFAIQNRIIKYTDRKWGKWIQCIPRDKDFIRRVIMSRGKFPHFLIKMFDLNVKEQEEYEKAKNDEELSNIIIRDAKGKGCKLLSKKVEETVSQMKVDENHSEKHIEAPREEIKDNPKDSTQKQDGN